MESDQEDPSPPPGPGEPAPIAPNVAPRAEAATFSLNRRTVTASNLISQASEAWQRDIGIWVLATVLMVLVGFGIPFFIGFAIGIMEAVAGDGEGATKAVLEGVKIGLQVLQTVIQGVLSMGFVAMGVHALNGRPAPISALFSQIPKALKYVLQVLAIWLPLVVLFVALAAIIVALSVGSIDLDMPMEDALREAAPGLVIFLLVSLPIYVYVFLGIMFAQVELAYNDSAGPVEAVVYAWRVVRGRRWFALGVGLISWLIAVGSMMLCGIGFLFGGPLASLIFTALYLALREGADVPAPDTSSTLGKHY